MLSYLRRGKGADEEVSTTFVEGVLMSRLHLSPEQIGKLTADEVEHYLAYLHAVDTREKEEMELAKARAKAARGNN